MFAFHLQREWRAMWQSPMRVAMLVSYTVLATWALVDGLRWQAQVEQVHAATPADLLTDRDAWLAELRKAEAGGEISAYAARPMNLTFLALHSPAPLAALAHGGESIHPHSALINGWRSEASLFRRYEVEGPSTLRLGRIDLLFVLTVLFPLFLMMLSFDVISVERSSARLRLFLIQGGQVPALLCARLFSALIPLLLVSVACVLIAALLTGATFVSVAIWFFALLVYALFWSAVAAVVAVGFGRPASGALAVLAAWAVLVVVLPSASQFLAQAYYPVPSRVAYLSEARMAEGETRRNLAARAEVYMAEHPDQGKASDASVPGYFRASYLSNIDINARTRPIVEAYASQQAAQRDALALARFVSPALAVQHLLHDASGTGAEHAAAFRRQARGHLNMLLEHIGPATVSRARLSVEQAQSIPRFQFKADGIDRRSWLALAWYVLLSCALLVAVVRLSKRLS